MKKILLTIILLSTPAFAFEDYMVISNTPVKSVSVQNSEILDVSVLYTIDNQKKNIIITPKKTSQTKINIDLLNQIGSKKIDVKITEKKTFINAPLDFNLFLLDSPPESYDIPKPPRLKEGK